MGNVSVLGCVLFSSLIYVVIIDYDFIFPWEL